MNTVSLLFSFLILSFATPAIANPFASCGGVEAKKFVQEDAYVAFVKAFKQTFDRMAHLSREEINANKLCLSGDSTPSNDCASRVKYFKKTLPLEWKKYRQAFALSSWNKQFLITKDSADGGYVAVSGCDFHVAPDLRSSRRLSRLRNTDSRLHGYFGSLSPVRRTR